MTADPKTKSRGVDQDALISHLIDIDKFMQEGRVMMARGLIRGLRRMVDDDPSHIVRSRWWGKPVHEYMIEKLGMDPSEFMIVVQEDDGGVTWR